MTDIWDIFSEWDSPSDLHEALISLQKDNNSLIRELAALKAGAPSIPDGWKLVPVEPTKKMIDIYWKHQNQYCYDTWKAILSAAPEYKPQ